MEQLISFRLLTSQLSLDEYKKLMCQLIDQEGTTIISDIFFKSFYDELVNGNKNSNNVNIKDIKPILFNKEN